jgi:FkbM family methyltransferase
VNDTTTVPRRGVRTAVRLILNIRGQRRTLFRQQMFDLMGRISPVLAVDSGNARFLVSSADRGVSRVLFGEGSYEQDIMAQTINLAESYTSRRPLLAGRTFIDVGANIGTTTIPALKVFGAADAVAIEPGLQNYKLLRCNVIANDIEDRVRTLRAALSDSTGLGELELDEDNGGDHRIRVRTDIQDGLFRESTRRTAQVPLLRFDDMVRDGQVDLERVGMVWMDVQGHEAHVLSGALLLLASEIPVATEYWPYGLRRAGGLEKFHELLARHYRTVVDIRESLRGTGVVELPATDVSALEGRYDGATYTDLLLLK